MKTTNLLKMGVLAVLCSVVSAFGDAYYSNQSSVTGIAFYFKSDVTRITTYHYDARGIYTGTDVTESSEDSQQTATLQPEDTLNQQDFYEKSMALGSPVDAEGNPQAYDDVAIERWEFYTFDHFDEL
jgi:hypothetical protein